MARSSEASGVAKFTSFNAVPMVRPVTERLPVVVTFGVSRPAWVLVSASVMAPPALRVALPARSWPSARSPPAVRKALPVVVASAPSPMASAPPAVRRRSLPPLAVTTAPLSTVMSCPAVAVRLLAAVVAPEKSMLSAPSVMAPLAEVAPTTSSRPVTPVTLTGPTK